MIGIGRWVRRFVRKYTKPIPGDKAQLWKKRLAISYAIIAWNAFGFVLYYMMTERADWPLFYGLKTEEEAQVRPGEVIRCFIYLLGGHLTTLFFEINFFFLPKLLSLY